MSLWTDFDAMLVDIHRHILTTRRPVEAADDPHKLLIGFQDSGSQVRWCIKVGDLKKSPRVAEMATVEERLRAANFPLRGLR